MKLIELAFIEKKSNLANKMENRITDEGKASIKVVNDSKRSVEKILSELESMAFSLVNKEEKNKKQVAKATAKELIQRILDRIK